MVSTLSPGATVIAVPPSQLQLPEDLRTTDPVPFEAKVLPPPAPAEGCGACAVCVCGIEAVASGRVREANGLSLNRDVSALQPAMAALISASMAARGKRRERNISTTHDMPPLPVRNTRAELILCGLIRL